MNYNKKILITLMPVLLAISILWCGKKDTSVSADKSQIIAQVNGENITAKQFMAKAEKLEKQLNLNLDIFQERKKLLDDMITSNLLYQKAIAENIDKEVESKEFLATQYLRHKIPDIQIPDDEALKYFETNKSKYEKVRVAHILIKPTKMGDKNSENEAAKRAANILIKVLNGEDFAKLAKEYSEDKANSNAGGDVGFFTRGIMVKEFEEAAFSLKESGDLSKVIKTQYGFHILKLLESEKGFETFKDAIKQKLKLEKQRKSFETLINDSKKGANIVVYDDNLRDMKILSEPMLLK